jgi:hypothetical protein
MREVKKRGVGGRRKVGDDVVVSLLAWERKWIFPGLRC